MLTPSYLLHATEPAEEIAESLHKDILDRIIERIMIRFRRGDDYILTAVDKWQLESLQQAGFLLEDIQKEIAKATGYMHTEIAAAMEDAGVTALEYDDAIYKAAGLDPVPLTQSPYMIQLMQRDFEATLGEWTNFTRTTATACQQSFIRACDNAYNLAMSGAVSPAQAVREALDTLISNGVYVEYPTGHRDTIETATARAVRAGISQASANITDARMDEMDWDIILVSSHLGARVTGKGDYTDHSQWQGKFYSKSGKDKRFPPYEVCGPGKVQGIHGAGCQHSHGPGDGEHNPFEQYDSEENKKQYDLEQRQRTLERRIRDTKRETMNWKTAMDSATDDAQRAEFEAKYQRKAALLQKQNAAYNDFCKENNLKRRSERLEIAKWDRSQAAKARAAAKKYAVDHPGSVVPKEYKPSAKKVLEKSAKTSTMEIQKFTEFHDGEEVNAFFYYDDEKRGLLAKKKSGYSKWMKELSEDERACILEYTAGGYGDINDYFRRRGSWQEINAERIEEMSKHLDSAIAKFQLKDNIVVQRGVMEDALDDIIEKYNITDNADFIGKVFRDDGYVSTTALTGNPVATTKPVLFEISVPAGIGRGAYVNELSGFTDAEYEFLLRKGADYTITGVEENAETGQLIVKMVMNNG